MPRACRTDVEAKPATRQYALTGAWSAAEACLFFIVADVAISAMALRRGLKTASRAAIVAALASVVGVGVMFAWVSFDPAGATATIVALPGIDRALVDETARSYSIPATLVAAF